MTFQLGLCVAAVFLICGETVAVPLDNNAPNDPLWPLFAARLSNTTGREVAIINALGLSNNLIKDVWMQYKAHMPSLTLASTPKPTTTPPPRPDIYQSAYSFSSSQTQRHAQKIQQQQRFDQANAVVGQILALVKQTTPKPVSANNVLPTANSLQSMSNADLLRMYAKLKDMNSQSAAVSQMAKLSALSSPQTQLTDMFGYSGQSFPSYGLLPTTTTTTPAPATTSASLGQLIQMYQKMYASADTTTTLAPDTTTSKQDAFDARVKQFFPQFNAMPLPADPALPAAASNTSAKANVSAANSTNAKANTEQMIFDALLFGPNPSPGNLAGPMNAAPATTTTTTLLPPLYDYGRSSKAKNTVSADRWVEDVIRTRASRDLGCRFMTELMGMEGHHDLLSTNFCDCKFMVPRIKAVRVGNFCVCCPPFVEDKAITFMSLFKRFKYMNEGSVFRVTS